MDIIYEKEDHSRRTAAVLEYRGQEAIHTVPAKCTDVDTGIIYNECFKNNKVLEMVTIPEPVYNISESAFAGCRDLETVDIPASVGYIGVNAFANCPDVSIFCEKDSVAHSYALENEIPFELK